MQWQPNITILGVFAGHESRNAQVFFRNALGVVGWRRLSPLTTDGCSNLLATAIAAQLSGKIVQLLITNAGEILAVSTL